MLITRNTVRLVVSPKNIPLSSLVFTCGISFTLTESSAPKDSVKFSPGRTCDSMVCVTALPSKNTCILPASIVYGDRLEALAVRKALGEARGSATYSNSGFTSTTPITTLCGWLSDGIVDRLPMVYVAPMAPSVTCASCVVIMGTDLNCTLDSTDSSMAASLAPSAEATSIRDMDAIMGIARAPEAPVALWRSIAARSENRLDSWGLKISRISCCSTGTFPPTEGRLVDNMILVLTQSSSEDCVITPW
mmetsp:Transcript_7800/g.14753  ORF Transcript_7800/g.14753 Transcript_7800/m.14753 type:complete len:248 (+) Transcript_7800:415-1158(+)